MRDLGQKQRQLREKRLAREELLLDLGALVYELYRQGKRAPELLQRKAAQLTVVDDEVRQLEAALEGGVVWPTAAAEPASAAAAADAEEAVVERETPVRAADEPVTEREAPVGAADEAVAERGAELDDPEDEEPGEPDEELAEPDEDELRELEGDGLGESGEDELAELDDDDLDDHDVGDDDFGASEDKLSEAERADDRRFTRGPRGDANGAEHDEPDAAAASADTREAPALTQREERRA